MCGIAGIVTTQKPVDRSTLEAMTDSLTHRGPEERGIWLNEKQTVGFGQRRLAIIDLSVGGRQPRVSAAEKVAITFNGEIYNYLELRQELIGLGYQFDSQSDTEVLLKSYFAWGKECVTKLNGMFAFAIWDGRTEELFAARDHIGEKPFKYYFDNTTFIFGSEIKALLQNSVVPRMIDWEAVNLALSFRFVPSPKTGFKFIYKLPAGHTLSWKGGAVTVNQYWDVAKEQNKKNYSKDQIWNLFVNSVQHRMISDRPIGAFLSGGIDSTSVVAAMSEVSTKPIETFAISIGGRSADLHYAALAAKYFHTTHHEIELGTINYTDTLEKLAQHYDEPFFDQSALPSIIINAEVKKYVTVVLSGDGGDELFGGYTDYSFAQWFSAYARLPQIMRQIIAAPFVFSKKKTYQMELLTKDFFSGYSEHYALWKSNLPKSKLYITKNDLFTDNIRSLVNEGDTANKMKQWFGGTLSDPVNDAAKADFRSRLPDGYLAKVDFAAMASAVEVRTPFLDRNLVAAAQSIPGSNKISLTQTKKIWKEIIAGKIPDEVIRRPKLGFAVPLQSIIQKELKSVVVEQLLSSNSSVASYFNKNIIEKMVTDHANGSADYSNHIWSLLMLELWIKTYQVS